MKVLLLDTYPLITEMITLIIHRARPLTKVTAIHSFNQLLKLIDKSDEINAIVIEPKSPGCFGFSSIHHIAQSHPHVKIVVLTDVDYEYGSPSSQQAHPYHFVNKTDDINAIFNHFKKIFHPVSLETSSKDIQQPNLKISSRHMQMLNLLNKGYSNKQISEDLGLTEGTVKVHFFNLYKMMQVNSRLEALHYAKKHGLIFE